jgi:hypothetical protein
MGPNIKISECKKCSSVVGELTGPSEMKVHISGVRCANCQTFIKWLSKDEAQKLDQKSSNWLESKWLEPDSQIGFLF